MKSGRWRLGSEQTWQNISGFGELMGTMFLNHWRNMVSSRTSSLIAGANVPDFLFGKKYTLSTSRVLRRLSIPRMAVP